MNEAEEMDGASIISSGEASEVLEAVEAPLDTITQPVGPGIVRDDDLSGRIARNDRFCAPLSNEGT
ncbi:hypothetical protein AA13595_1689 [Gluconacetobacter johannae DSM 13595]|nr:hypothetical protein AA13595_1689 [Gluconacetobacter johannae DSM 13595]